MADRQPFAEHAHRLLALAELQRVEVYVSAPTFTHLHYLLRKGRTRTETVALLTKLNPNSEIEMGSARGPRAGLGGPPNPSCPRSNFLRRPKK